MPKQKSASVVAVNRDGLVLMCPWKRDTRYVSLPGGKGEEGESHEEIAVREFYEETGYLLDPKRLLAVIRDPFDERDYVGFITTEDLSDIEFSPKEGETQPFWGVRNRLVDASSCMYAAFSSKAWLWLTEEFI